MIINRAKNKGYPVRSMIHPPSMGNIAGMIFPAPAMPVYRALFFVPDISSNTPFMEIKYIERIAPPIKKINMKGGMPDDSKRIKGTDIMRSTLT